MYTYVQMIIPTQAKAHISALHSLYGSPIGSHAVRLYGWLAFTLVSGSQDAVMLYMVCNLRVGACF